MYNFWGHPVHVCCNCNGSHRRSRNRNIAGNKQSDTYYRSPLKNDQCMDERHSAMLGQSQYNAGNRFVEHEYSYIADLQPPISTAGPDFGCIFDEEIDGSGQGVIGSGQPRLGQPECRQMPLHGSAMQLVDRPPQNLTQPLSSVVSLADDDSIAVRGVAPPSRGAKQSIDPRLYMRAASFPAASGYCDSIDNAARSQ